MEGDSLWDRVIFNDRPTQQDIQAVEEADRVIVVRIPVRSLELPRDTLQRKAWAYMEEIGLPDGHPRVLPFFDVLKGGDEKEYRRRVLQHFQNVEREDDDPWESLA